MEDSEKIDLLEKCRKGKFDRIIKKYIDDCAEKNVFPNVAGFCRYCGVGIGELETLAEEFPREIDRLCTYLEDEALNSDIAAAIITPYMKRRLGYGEEKKGEKKELAPTVVFKHDIMKDGE